MKFTILLLGFFILMCSAETDNTNQITPPEDSVKTTIEDTTIDSTETDTNTSDDSSGTEDSTKVDDSTTTIIGKLNRDTIYQLRPTPDTTIYGNQMFKYKSEESWLIDKTESGKCFIIMGSVSLVRNDNNQDDTIKIIITSDSLITDTLFVVYATIEANDSNIKIINVENLYNSITIPIEDTLVNTEVPFDGITTSDKGEIFIVSTHKNYLPSISRLTDNNVSPSYYYSIFSNFNYLININDINTGVLWNTIR